MAIRKKRTSTSWSVVEAKAHFDVVIDEVEDERPQTLVKNKAEQAMVVPVDGWGPHHWHEGTLLDFFRSSGLGDYELDITRSDDAGRDLDP